MGCFQSKPAEEESKVATLTKVASTKVAEAKDALAATVQQDSTAAPEVQQATDAVQGAQNALENVVNAEGTPTAADLTVAQEKVAEAEAAVAEAVKVAGGGAEAEMKRVESSLQAAKQIVSDAISKAEA